MDENTIIELKVMEYDDEGNVVTHSTPIPFTLGQLRDWLASEDSGGG